MLFAGGSLGDQRIPIQPSVAAARPGHRAGRSDSIRALFRETHTRFLSDLPRDFLENPLHHFASIERHHHWLLTPLSELLSTRYFRYYSLLPARRWFVFEMRGGKGGKSPPRCPPFNRFRNFVLDGAGFEKVGHG
jgi:hypothetical protein